ncbi:MAG: T9SS type A sorting domain-containing protein [Ignavibacteriae bacterium]|nr:T9SS type A sorting domain-containing protein [Ignavibacteriota bacterium]
MKTTFKIIILLLFTCILNSQNNEFITINGKKLLRNCAFVLHEKNKTETIQSSENRLVFIVNKDIIEPVLKEHPQKIKIENFPISLAELRNIYLIKGEVPIDENTVWLRATKDGIKKGVQLDFSFYTGWVDSEQKSKVYFGYGNQQLYCIIERSNGEKYFIVPSSKVDNDKYPHFMVASNFTYANDELSPFICLTKDYSNIPSENEIKNKLKNKIQSDKMLQLEIALEGANDYFQLHGTHEKAYAYMTAVMTIVSKIYLDQLNVKIHIPYVMIYEDASQDPYANRDDVGQKLWRMPNAWKNRSNVPRTIACLFAGLHPNGGYYTAGISMGINTLCDKGRGYCVFGILGSSALPTMNYITDVSVRAHEIGHACGGPHTHYCNYFGTDMIDTCVTKNKPYYISDACAEEINPIPRPGTIMSYCHLTNSTRSVEYVFGDRMTPIIRSALDEANCISEVQEPTISLLNPTGDETLKSGKKEEIIWTSTLVNLVSIKYSSDNGNNWNIIASGKSAADKSFVWTVPAINSNEVIIIIYDMGNSEIADSVLKPFAVRMPVLQINGPTEGQKFGQKEKYKINWVSVFIDSIKVLFTSNGGTNWSEIIGNVKGNNYEMEFPQVVSDECKIKIESLTEDKLVSESKIFSIGISNVILISPNGGEKLCAGQYYEIKWESEYINNLWLEYSTDNGSVWRKVSLGQLNALEGKYLWKVPARISDDCILKIYPQFDKNLILDISDSTFKIDSCQTGLENEFNNLKFGIIDVKPNPVNDEAEVTIINAINSKMILLALYDESGRMVSNLGQFNITNEEKINIKIKLPELNQGNYFIKACSGTNCESYKIRVIR